MAFYAVFFCLCRRNLPIVGFMTILAGQIHLKMHFMLADITNIGMALYCTVCPVRPRFDMRIVALVTVYLHGRIRRNLYFNSLLYGGLIGLKMLYINGTVINQFLPNRLVAVTEETFFSAWHKIRGPVCMTVEAWKVSHGQTDI